MMPSYFFYLQLYFLALENVLRKLFTETFSIVTLIIANFHLYLIQLWWQFFQISVNGDVVYAQTWEVLTLKNPVKPPPGGGGTLGISGWGCAAVTLEPLTYTRAS